MSSDEIIRAWKAANGPDAAQGTPEQSPAENPAGEVNLSDEDLGEVAGGTESLSCTGDATYCQGTCGIPFLTYGCCKVGLEDTALQ